MASPTIDQILALRPNGGVEPPQWSPDGRSVLFASPMGGGLELWSADAETGLLTRLTVGLGGVGHLGSVMPRWSPSGDYIAYVSAKSGADEVWLWPTDGGPSRQLTRLGSRIEAMTWSADGRFLALCSNRRGSFDIYRTEVTGGETIRLTGHPNYEVYPWVLPDGRILYQRMNDAWTDRDFILMEQDGSGPQVVLRDTDLFDYHYGRTVGYPMVSPGGTQFLFRSQRSGWLNLWVGSLEGGEPHPLSPAAAEQSEQAWSPDGRLIAYCENHNGTIELRVVAADGGEPRRIVTPAMGVCSMPAWSPDGSRIAYLQSTPASPNDLYVVDVATGVSRPLTRSTLGGGFCDRLVAPEKVVYPAPDGIDIHAYLYRAPDQTPGTRLPAIIWIHGGPTLQFFDHFQSQVQFFLSQGYHVLMPNIRGSSGYGRAFEDLNNKDWCHGDLADAVAGAAYLKTLSGIDGDHIGITGGSYGGIISMAAVSLAPGVFQAAVPISGYGDFEHQAEENELRHVKMMAFELGPLPESVDTYRRCSPLYFVHQAETPCFIAHGEGRYPGSSQSLDYALALEREYKPFWYKAYPGETYYIASPQNLRRLWTDMLAFFDLHLKDLPHSLPDDGQRPLTQLLGAIHLNTWRQPGSELPSTRTFSQPARDTAN